MTAGQGRGCPVTGRWPRRPVAVIRTLAPVLRWKGPEPDYHARRSVAGQNVSSEKARQPVGKGALLAASSTQGNRLMKTRLKKIIWTVLLCVLVLSTILALFQWYYVSSVQQSLASIRRAMREQGFKTDLADFNFSAAAARRPRMAALMFFSSPQQLDSDGHQLDLLPAMSNDTATVIWKLNSLNNGTNIHQWSDLHAMLDTNRGKLDAACAVALSSPIRFGADASRGMDMFGRRSVLLLHLSQRLNLRAMLELHDGNPDVAWTNLLAPTRLVTACEAE